MALFLAMTRQLKGNAIDHLVGVLFAIRSDPELAETVRDQFSAGWDRGVREIVVRAAARGEVPEHDDHFFGLFSKVGVSVMLMRYLLDEGPLDGPFVGEIVDGLLLPILQSRA